MDAEEVVWAPRTIGPVPEEMELEDSLTRRFLAHGPGPQYRPLRIGSSDEVLHPECVVCGGPSTWGLRTCRDCPGPALDIEESEAELVRSRGIDWAAVVVLFVVLAAVVTWGWVTLGDDGHRAAPGPCVAQVGEEIAIDTEC